MPGPPPKRSDQRRRRNKAEPVEKAFGQVAKPPSAPRGWHPVARRWFSSLKASGQSQFYEASDWATAFVVAEDMSRAFHAEGPVGGAAMAAWLRAMASLMVTEGDRRRVRLELQAPDAAADADAEVASIHAFRDRHSAGS